MFIISLTYVKPLDAVDAELEQHIAYPDKYYAANKSICSGRKNPRVGSAILCNAKTRDEVDQIIGEDPFCRAGVAEYEITKFEPTKYAQGFEKFIA